MDEEQAVFDQLTLSDVKKSKFHSIKAVLSSLRKFFKTESSLKMLKNTFHLKYSSRFHNI